MLNYFGFDKELQETLIKNNQAEVLVGIYIHYKQWEKTIQFETYLNEDQRKLVFENQALDFYKKKDYEKSREFSLKTNNQKMLIKSLSKLGDLEELEKMRTKITDKKLLEFLSEKLIKNFQPKPAAQILSQIGKSEQAFQLSVRFQLWSLAAEISMQNNYPQLDNIVAAYAEET